MVWKSHENVFIAGGLKIGGGGANSARDTPSVGKVSKVSNRQNAQHVLSSSNPVTVQDCREPTPGL